MTTAMAVLEAKVMAVAMAVVVAVAMAVVVAIAVVAVVALVAAVVVAMRCPVPRVETSSAPQGQCPKLRRQGSHTVVKQYVGQVLNKHSGLRGYSAY